MAPCFPVPISYQTRCQLLNTKAYFLHPGLSCNVVPHRADRAGCHLSFHHQRPLRPRYAVPRKAPKRTAQGRTIPPPRTSRLRPLRRRESRTREGTPRTPTTSPPHRRQFESLTRHVTINVSTGN